MNSHKMGSAQKVVKLKGLAWDHPRGYEPLIALSGEFEKTHPNVSIAWQVHSLKEFDDRLMMDLIAQYDIIIIDHPYMGQADKNGLFIKLEQYISEDVLHLLEKQSVGPSFKSYRYGSHIYALPVDSAALVTAFRKDIVNEVELRLPRTRSELKNFYNQIPSGYSIAWPLSPIDFWCTFMTLCAQDANSNFIKERIIDTKIGSSVLDEIKFHLELIHPNSMKWSPIQILDRMGNGDEIIYSPYIFGYSNYARNGYTQHPVRFTNSPVNENTRISTILGGSGLAVSSTCRNPTMAVKFVEFMASAEVQRGIFTLNGGQAGNVKAWKYEYNNILCNDFFKDTLATFENAYVRPQHPGWNQFQDQGANFLHRSVSENSDSEKIMTNLNELYQSCIEEKKWIATKFYGEKVVL